MRDDKDLNFLANIDSKNLDSLVQILTTGKDGKTRISESLTSHSLYEEHAPDHQRYWHLIADEIQRYGGNSLATALRGKGVLYHEVVSDVAKKMKITVEESDSAQQIEQHILLKIITDSLSELSPQELKELSNELDLDTTDFTEQAVMMAIKVSMGQSDLITYKVASLVASAVAKELLGNGLKLTTNVAISRTLGFLLGPIGWAVTSVWTAADIAGPAYRVTIPAVIQIALLRAQLKHEKI